ncbi:MAG: hypothetical protein FJ291_03355 [Planctomycetes bacterium]|nr:hypothetical protein [Planctomycetota bacterium]
MARPLRIDLPNAAYYVTSRGLEGQGIVRDEEDCGRWLARLDAVARRRWRVVAFVVMQSHHHLLVETPEANLSAGMHDLNAGYAMAFNCRHGRHGPLFAGRFKAILIEPGYRYWEISRHIHLNPVRLGHAKRPQDWPFGSCGVYLGTVLAPTWLAWREAMAGHGATVAEAQEAYGRFLAEGVERPGVSPLWAATVGVGLGSPEFVWRLAEWLEGRMRRRGLAAATEDGRRQTTDDSEVGRAYLHAERAAARVKVDSIERAVCAVFGVEEGRLRERRRWRNEARAVALYLCRKWAGMTLEELGERFGGVSAQAVSRMEAQLARDLLRDTGLGERVGRCEGELGLRQVEKVGA